MGKFIEFFSMKVIETVIDKLPYFQELKDLCDKYQFNYSQFSSTEFNNTVEKKLKEKENIPHKKDFEFILEESKRTYKATKDLLKLLLLIWPNFKLDTLKEFKLYARYPTYVILYVFVHQFSRYKVNNNITLGFILDNDDMIPEIPYQENHINFKQENDEQSYHVNSFIHDLFKEDTFIDINEKKEIIEDLLNILKPNMSESLQKALTLAFDFLENKNDNHFLMKKMDKEFAVMQLLSIICNPDLINQGATTLCGRAAYMYTLAKFKPDEFVAFGLNLYKHGKTHIPFNIYMNLNCLTVPKDLIEHMLMAIANTQNKFLSYFPVTCAKSQNLMSEIFDKINLIDEHISGVTPPKMLYDCFDKTGFSVSHDSACILSPEFTKPPKIISLFTPGGLYSKQHTDMSVNDIDKINEALKKGDTCIALLSNPLAKLFPLFKFLDYDNLYLSKKFYCNNLNEYNKDLSEKPDSTCGVQIGHYVVVLGLQPYDNGYYFQVATYGKICNLKISHDNLRHLHGIMVVDTQQYLLDKKNAHYLQM